MYEIKHDGDVPEKNAPGLGQAWRTKYPFRTMSVGDYFNVTEDESNARMAAYKFGSRNNMRFTGSRQEDGSMRIWRIE